MNSKIGFFDLNSYVLENILNFLGIDDIKAISMVNTFGYNITNKFFETMCVLNLPEVLTSDIIEMFITSNRQYKSAVYRLSRRVKGNILEPLKRLPFKVIIKTTFYWESLDEWVFEQANDFQVELYSSQIDKADFIADHVTKVNFCHRPILVLSDLFKIFPNIKELTLSNVKADNIFYEQETLTKPQNLKILRISWASFFLTPNLLNIFKGLTFLEFKCVKDVEFIKMLIDNNCATLKRLVIELTTPEIAVMTISSQLTHLEIDSSKHNVSLKEILEKQRNLRSLVLKSPLVDNFLMLFLEKSRTIHKLSVENPISTHLEICRLRLPSVINFHGNVNELIPVADNMKFLKSETFNRNLKLNNLSELHLLQKKTSEKQHLEFESFEDFKDYHMSDPLDTTVLKNTSITKLTVDWIISLHEFKKICNQIKQLELIQFEVRSQDLKVFFEFLNSWLPDKLRYVIFKLEILSLNEYCLVQKVLNDSIDEQLLGHFFKPFSVFVDYDFKNEQRNIIYFSSH